MLAAVVAIALALTSEAATETVGGIKWTYEIEGGKAKVYNNHDAAISTDTSGAVTVPSTLGGCPVTCIGEYAFVTCYGVTSVTIPAGVTEIGDYAFHYCNSLASVSVPSSVKRIGLGAFRMCNSLKLSVPNTVTEIDDYAFEGCDAMANANGFVVVRNVLYWYAGSASTLTVPSGVTRIASEAFSECGTLKSVTLPASVTSVGNYEFYNCNSLLNVVYQGAVPEVGYNMYSGTPGELVSVVPSSGWGEALAEGEWQERLIRAATPSGKATVFFCCPDRQIGTCDSPFKVVAKGTAVGTLPTATSASHRFVGWFTARDGGTQVTTATKVNGDVTYYAHWTKNEQTVGGITWTYSVCDGEASVYNNNNTAIPTDTSGAITVPSTLGGYPVTSIGPYAFEMCGAITKVTIPGSVRNIEGCAFMECTSLESVAIPNNVTNIGDFAFSNCAVLKGVNVPAGVVNVGDAAFVGCDALADADGFVIVRNRLHNYCGSATAVTVPAGVVRVGPSAFTDCGAIKSIALPDSVLSIGTAAFRGCGSLTGVSLPEGLLEIESYAFEDCTSLASITIPSSVTTLDSGTFCNCSSLKTVTYCGSAINGWSLYQYTPADLKSIVPAAGWDDKLAEGTWCDRAIEAAPGSTGKWKDSSGVEWTYRKMNGKAEIFKADEESAIPKATSGAITVPSTLGGCPVTRIGKHAFFECASITGITIPASVKSIGQEAFFYCEGLKSVTLTSGLTSLGDYAFFGCAGLKEITIPASVRRVGYCAFGLCSSLKTVTYLGACPQGATYWGSHNIYGSSPDDLVSIVPAAAGGWEQALAAGTWMDRAIRSASADKYKVTFGKNGGTGGDNYVTATYGKPMPTPRTAPTLSGYTFGGYYDTLAVDEKGVSKGKQYYDGSMKSVRSWDKKAAATLWAKWTNKVTFGKNGGTGGDNYVTCTKGQPMPKRTMPTKSGYVFDGYWSSTGAGGVKYYNADGTSAHTWDKSGSVTLWAKWATVPSVKVTLSKNGGTGGDSYVTATYGKPMPTPRTAPTLKGWSFGGYWDTLACDEKGNPKGKQYYNSKMESVRAWDKTAATTLWAKWTVKVTLGKNGGTGGDSTVTVIKGQPFPKRTMPTKSGYTFGGYFVSASTKTGQCYNPDGTGTTSMKWSTGGTPTIWALWTKTSSFVEVAPPTAAPASAAPAAAEPAAIPAGLYSGVLADGTGTFCLLLDDADKGLARTACLYVVSEGDTLTAECTAEEAGGILLLTTEDGEFYAFDPLAGTLFGI